MMRFPGTVALRRRSCGIISNRLLSKAIIIDSDAEQFESPAAMMLLPVDYPLPYRGETPGSKLYALPTDYKVDDQAIQPEVFLFKGNNSRNRLFFRTSFRLSETKFTAATFLLDAGLCSHFRFSDDLYNLMLSYDRIIQGGPTDYMEVNINGVQHQCLVQNDLPHIHKPVNVIGLPMFFALGLKFDALNIHVATMDKDRVVRNHVKFESFKFL
jgi:hypothetical protein